MQKLQAQVATKRIMSFICTSRRINKTKKVGDVLKNLGLNEIGTGKSDLSINHDNLLYK